MGHQSLPAASAGAQPAAIVHIGTHKTGTTSLQSWAEAEREPLRAATGLTYYHGLFGPSHYEIPMLCLRPDRGMPMRARLPDWSLPAWQEPVEAHIRAQAALPDPVLLVSAEALSYVRHPEEVSRLVNLLAPRRVTAVVVLRERSAYLRSYRGTMMRLGFPPSPYPESFAYVEDDSWLADYDALVGVYRDGLGAENVVTVDYETAMRRHESVIPAVLEAAGADSSAISSWQGMRPANASSPKTGRRRVARARVQAAERLRGLARQVEP